MLCVLFAVSLIGIGAILISTGIEDYIHQLNADRRMETVERMREESE
jgi:hypothetical protein